MSLPTPQQFIKSYHCCARLAGQRSHFGGQSQASGSPLTAVSRRCIRRAAVSVASSHWLIFQVCQRISAASSIWLSNWKCAYKPALNKGGLRTSPCHTATCVCAKSPVFTKTATADSCGIFSAEGFIHRNAAKTRKWQRMCRDHKGNNTSFGFQPNGLQRKGFQHKLKNEFSSKTNRCGGCLKDPATVKFTSACGVRKSQETRKTNITWQDGAVLPRSLSNLLLCGPFPYSRPVAPSPPDGTGSAEHASSQICIPQPAGGPVLVPGRKPVAVAAFVASRIVPLPSHTQGCLHLRRARHGSVSSP